MSTFDSYGEYAAEAEHSAMMAYRDIASQTGLKLETVARLGVSNNSSVLFGNDGKFRNSTELRSMEAAGALAVSLVDQRRRTLQQKLVDLYEMRWPETQTPRQKLAMLGICVWVANGFKAMGVPTRPTPSPQPDRPRLSYRRYFPRRGALC